MRREYNLTSGEVTEYEDAPIIILSAEEKRTILPSLSAWQMRKVLNQFNLRAQVEAAVAQSDQITKDAWAYANDFQRDSVTLNAMAAGLGLTTEQVDQMFIIGATL